MLVGVPINGQKAGDLFGTSVSLSADGSRLASGAPLHASGAGSARVFEKTGSVFDEWVQLGDDGADMDGDDGDGGGRMGAALALSSDGTTLIGGAPRYTLDTPASGKATVFYYEVR